MYRIFKYTRFTLKLKLPFCFFKIILTRLQNIKANLQKILQKKHSFNRKQIVY